MKRTTLQRLLALALVVMTVVALIPAFTVTSGAEEVKTYTLNVSDLEAYVADANRLGTTDKIGQDGFFTIHHSDKDKVEANEKTFSDDFTGTKRLNWGGSTSFGDVIKNALEITTDAASTIKVWWVSGGDGREVAVFNADGTQIAVTAEGSAKNGLYVSTIGLPAAGKYYIGNSGGNNNFYKVEAAVVVPTEKTYSLNVSDLEAYAADANRLGTTEKIG
ncbi:MAG: hypothetical protein IKC32_05935, partial [Clostridia bacterium]|nr:hypothetical protein [Clostridia bacterium]